MGQTILGIDHVSHVSFFDTYFSEKGNAEDETCLDFSEADDMLPQEELLTELEKTAIHTQNWKVENEGYYKKTHGTL